MTPIEARVLHISPGELLYRYYQLYSNSAGLMKLDVFYFAPTCMLDTLTVLTSVQTPHRGLIGWMSHISTQRTNNETSIFKMSPLRLNSIFTASSCLRRLSVSTWLNSITIHTMEIQGRLTPVAFLWRPVWRLESFHDGWRTCVNWATDGDLCQATSADIILLPANFNYFYFFFPQNVSRLGRSKMS